MLLSWIVTIYRNFFLWSHSQYQLLQIFSYCSVNSLRDKYFCDILKAFSSLFWHWQCFKFLFHYSTIPSQLLTIFSIVFLWPSNSTMSRFAFEIISFLWSMEIFIYLKLNEISVSNYARYVSLATRCTTLELHNKIWQCIVA